MKEKIDPEFPCKCGHEKERHLSNDLFCLGCFTFMLGKKSGAKPKLVCNHFTPDNFAYVKKLQRQRDLKKYGSKSPLTE